MENGGTRIDIHKNCVLANENGAFEFDVWGPEEDGSISYPCSGPARGEIPVSRGTGSRAKPATPAHRRIKTAAHIRHIILQAVCNSKSTTP